MKMKETAGHGDDAPKTHEQQESDESDIVEQDVKVCDICGDTGREDLLAICSTCTDGAEHTYCMRKMLRKVPLPSTNWMCEECKFAQEIVTHLKQGAEPKRLSKSGSGILSAKRIADNVQVAPPAKRQAIDTTIGSPRSSSPVKMASLSRESSFKNIDKDRPRPPPQVSISNRPTNDDTAQSPVAGPRLQTHKGSLFKSKSFNATNSKPKVKLVDKVVPQKQKGGKEHGSIDVKERSKYMQKSMSFKSANPGRPNAPDSKLKMFSPRISPALDSKGSRSMKERNAFDRKNLSKLDRPLVSSTSSSTVSTPKSGESSLLSFSSNSRDLKVQAEGRLSASKATRRTIEVPITSVGVLSEQKSKDDASFTSDKVPCNSVEGTIPNGLPRSLEASSQSSEKAKESSSMRSRSTVMSSFRSTLCQKCKEIGHSAEFCTNGDGGSSEAPGIDTCARSCREEEARGVSNLKEAIHAALLRKPEIQRKKRTLDQADEISTSSTELSSEIACHDQANKSKLVASGEANTKDFTTSHGLVKKMLAIPEYEYIWRGCFEVHRSGSSLELYGGIQAHLSTCVSPRVPQVARKFPQKLSFHEVPRLSAWPAQFYEGGAKEDNIALYFFAKDLESYERNYKSLLDGMIKNDLALKGNFEGVELLIFPSNQLPENSQRWNMLFFLWGVFKARRESNSSNDRVVQLEKKAPNDVMENLCSPESSKVNGDCNDQKVSRLQDSSSSRSDCKYTSDDNKTTTPSTREESPSDGAKRSKIGDRTETYCASCVDGKDCSSSKEEVGMSGVVNEKEVLEVVGSAGERELKGSSSSSDCRKISWKRKSDVGEDKVCIIEDCVEKVIPEDLGSSSSSTRAERERRFFPVDPRDANNNSSGVDWKAGGFSLSGDEQFPNLELALGAETKQAAVPPQHRMVPPFLVEEHGEENDDDAEQQGDVSASLSLSLSFSMAAPEQQRPPKPQVAPNKAAERQQRVNTSLLLFGGFRDK